jgi:hypothetical protein
MEERGKDDSLQVNNDSAYWYSYDSNGHGRMFGNRVRIVRERDEPWADQNPVTVKQYAGISVEGAKRTAFFGDEC